MPPGFAGGIGMIRNWLFTVFYVSSELWGDIVLSLLFWGLANETTTLQEAALLYPLFGVGANIGQVRGRAGRTRRERKARSPHEPLSDMSANLHSFMRPPRTSMVSVRPICTSSWYHREGVEITSQGGDLASIYAEKAEHYPSSSAPRPGACASDCASG